jgi:hypothetical protein
MKQSTKALLFSGLVFPGAGHFSLELFSRGLIFFLPSFVSLILLVHYALGKAFDLAIQIAQGAIPLDKTVITNLITTVPPAPEMLRVQISTWIIIICWLLGIVDTYRQGRIADHKDS